MKRIAKPQVKHFNTKNFHRHCVRYLKWRFGRIDPRDQRYENIAVALEQLSGVRTPGTAYERCKEAAFTIGFIVAAPASRWSQSKVVVDDRPSRLAKRGFFASAQWKRLRYATIQKHGAQCAACKATNVKVHVDHIKPISKRWDLRLDPNNLQVLCEDCNLGKSDLDETDWREPDVLWDQ